MSNTPWGANEDPFDQRYRCATCNAFVRPDYFGAAAGRNVHAVYDTSTTGRPSFTGFCGPLLDFDPAAALAHRNNLTENP